jgi:hypothetical protein
MSLRSWGSVEAPGVEAEPPEHAVEEPDEDRHRRQRDNLAGLPEEHPMLTPGVGVADQLKLLAAQRMERVDDLEPSRPVGTVYG